jgi:hypothetical protein
VLKILSGDRPSILQGDCITKNILVGVINISFRVIELRENKGLFSAIFKIVRGKNFVLENLSGDWPSILQGDCISKNM